MSELGSGGGGPLLRLLPPFSVRPPVFCPELPAEGGQFGGRTKQPSPDCVPLGDGPLNAVG